MSKRIFFCEVHNFLKSSSKPPTFLTNYPTTLRFVQTKLSNNFITFFPFPENPQQEVQRAGNAAPIAPNPSASNAGVQPISPVAVSINAGGTQVDLSAAGAAMSCTDQRPDCAIFSNAGEQF